MALGGTCSTCPRRPDYPVRCVEEEPIQWRDDAADDGGTICPVLLTQLNDEYLKGWSMLERGLLPSGGGWSEQEAHWMQAFDAIGPAVSRATREATERARAQGDGGHE